MLFLRERVSTRRDSGSKVELEEVQGALTETDQLTNTVIHEDEVTTKLSEAQTLRKSSRILIVPKKYGFLISE